MSGSIILIAVGLVILFWGVGAYKRLVRLQNKVRNAFSKLDGQLKRRYDLVPNLVETARGYMKHERETLEAVIAVRNEAVAANSKAAADPADAGAMRQMATAEEMLSATLGKMLVLSESYPELKANENMMQLVEELTAAESRIAFARQTYNDGVTQYNTSRAQFPGSIIAVTFAFKPAELLQSTEPREERKPVNVSF
jgi:LemA protein